MELLSLDRFLPRRLLVFAELSDTVLASLSTERPLQLLMIAFVVYFIAGIIKGTLGIGFPTAAVSLLAQFTDARTAITIVIMPMLITNVWQVLRSREFVSVIRQVWLLLVLMLLFIAIFSQLASTVRVDILTAVLGGIVALYSLHSLYARSLDLNPVLDTPAQVAAGISAGIMGGLVSVWAPPILIYLSARRLPKDQFVATAGCDSAAGQLRVVVELHGIGCTGLRPVFMLSIACCTFIAGVQRG